MDMEKSFQDRVKSTEWVRKYFHSDHLYSYNLKTHFLIAMGLSETAFLFDRYGLRIVISRSTDK